MDEIEGTKRHSRQVMYWFAAAAIVLSAVLSIPWPRRSAPLIAVSERRVLPDVALKEPGGGTWRLSDHRGQVVLINYWATWCGPCRVETPGLVRLATDLGPAGLAIVGISMDTGERIAAVQAFVQRYGVTYPIAFPEAMSQMATGMVGLPTTLLVDREGRVAKTYVGQTPETEFRADVEKVLKGSL